MCAHKHHVGDQWRKAVSCLPKTVVKNIEIGLSFGLNELRDSMVLGSRRQD